MPTVLLRTPEHAARAIAIIQGAIGKEPPMEVIIREHKKDRSSAQHRLYWLWLTAIGNELGETKDDLHERYKGKFLVRIFERDDSEYAQMIQTVRNVYRLGMKKEAEALRRQIVSLTSTTKANVKQFTEYLNDIESDAAGMGIRLPHPDDVYLEAMGRAA